MGSNAFENRDNKSKKKKKSLISKMEEMGKTFLTEEEKNQQVEDTKKSEIKNEISVVENKTDVSSLMVEKPLSSDDKPIIDDSNVHEKLDLTKVEENIEVEVGPVENITESTIELPIAINDKKDIIKTENSNRAISDESDNGNIFSLTRVDKPKNIDRNYIIKQKNFDTLTKYAKIKGQSRNSFVVDLIRIGIKEELYKITPDSIVTIGKPKKTKLNIKVPEIYDSKLDSYKEKLIKDYGDEFSISKSEILDSMLEILLNRF